MRLSRVPWAEETCVHTHRSLASCPCAPTRRRRRQYASPDSRCAPRPSFPSSTGLTATGSHPNTRVASSCPPSPSHPPNTPCVRRACVMRLECDSISLSIRLPCPLPRSCPTLPATHPDQSPRPFRPLARWSPVQNATQSHCMCTRAPVPLPHGSPALVGTETRPGARSCCAQATPAPGLECDCVAFHRQKNMPRHPQVLDGHPGSPRHSALLCPRHPEPWPGMRLSRIP